MWQAPVDKPRATPEQFNEHWLTARPGEPTEIHIQEILSLAGSIHGRRVLDLGGGPLLAESGMLHVVGEYTLVDFSVEACDRARRASWYDYGSMTRRQAIVVEADALDWLDRNKRQFDVCLCFGLIEYLPPYGLHVVLEKCPAPVLCLGTAAAEGYLRYPGRITVPSVEDVERASKRYGWREIKRLSMPSHVWARYEREGGG